MIDAPIQQNLGRAKNALQDFLIQKLYIPKVYFDADWDGARVDVLAIDRDGSGDVHTVMMVPPQGRFIAESGMVPIGNILFNAVIEFMSLKSHYRYAAVVSDEPDTRRFDPAHPFVQKSLAEDGVGRIGILYVDLSEDAPSVRVILKAERFRSSKEIVELADKYVAEHTANWEVRE